MGKRRWSQEGVNDGKVRGCMEDGLAGGWMCVSGAHIVVLVRLAGEREVVRRFDAQILRRLAPVQTKIETERGVGAERARSRRIPQTPSSRSPACSNC